MKAILHITGAGSSLLTLSEVEALALAQFVKRVTWKEMHACALDDAECYEIRSALERLRTALAEAGFAPR